MSVQSQARPAGRPLPAEPAPEAGAAATAFAPPPKLRRRPALVALSVAFVAVGALGAAYLTTAVGNTVPVLAVRADVARGEVITADDLAVVRISLDPALSTIPGSQADAVVGMRAATDLPAGGLVTAGSVTDQDVPAVGESVVGISLRAGQMPGRELRPGDAVRVVSTPRQGDDPPLQTPASVPAVVVATRTVPETGEVVLDVTVPQSQAAGLVAAAATGRVAVVLDGAVS